MSPSLKLKVTECEPSMYEARALTDISRVRTTITPEHIAVPPDCGRSRRVGKQAHRMTSVRESRRHFDDGPYPGSIAELQCSPVRGCPGRVIAGRRRIFGIRAGMHHHAMPHSEILRLRCNGKGRRKQARKQE